MRKWHRVSGVVASGFLVTLAITGILLNHPTWFKASDQPPITVVCPIPDQPLQFVGTTQGLYVSQDDVTTLKKQVLPFPDDDVTDIVYDPHTTTLYVAYKTPILLKSQNLGQTFKRLPLPETVTEITSLAVLDSHQDVVLLIGSGNVLRYENGNATLIKEMQHSDWYTVVKKVHTGYIFMPFLKWAYDGAALILVGLVVSGLWLFFRRY